MQVPLQSDMEMDRTKADIPGHFPPAALIKRSLFCLPHPLLGDEHLPESFIMKVMVSEEMSNPQYVEHLPDPGERLERQKCSHPLHQSQLLLQQLRPQSARCQSQSNVFLWQASLHVTAIRDPRQDRTGVGCVLTLH